MEPLLAAEAETADAVCTLICCNGAGSFDAASAADFRLHLKIKR